MRWNCDLGGGLASKCPDDMFLASLIDKMATPEESGWGKNTGPSTGDASQENLLGVCYCGSFAPALNQIPRLGEIR